MRIALSTLVLATTTTIASIATTGCRNNVGDEGWFANAGDVPPLTDEQGMQAECTPRHVVKGIDVSYNQGHINWRAVKDDGVRFAFIRVSDGLGYKDSQFDRNWREARDAHVIRGAYQYFRPDEDPVAQADLVIRKIGHLKPGDLPPALDVEDDGGKTPDQIAHRIHQWSKRIRHKLHVRPFIYTGPYFWKEQVHADFHKHKLWIAHYGTQCPLVPGSWSHWTFHQFKSTGRVRGIAGDVDMDHFRGTMRKLKKLTKHRRHRH